VERVRRPGWLVVSILGEAHTVKPGSATLDFDRAPLQLKAHRPIGSVNRQDAKQDFVGAHRRCDISRTDLDAVEFHD
jgi:hypothetical protein